MADPLARQKELEQQFADNLYTILRMRPEPQNVLRW